MTKLHAGGKFDCIRLQSFRRTARRRRVAASTRSAKNSISRSGATVLPGSRTYSKGEPTSKLKKAGASKKRGTKVHFLPDKIIFTATEYNFDTLAQRLRELAFLNKGLHDHADRRAHDRRQDRRSEVR